MKLSCLLIFPDIWRVSVAGVTANLHRNGVLVACDLSSARQDLPVLGERATVRIHLPANNTFTPRSIDCETTLIRILRAGSREWQFALRIGQVNFSDQIDLAHLDAESCRYVV